jgi:hypothetical protein
MMFRCTALTALLALFILPIVSRASDLFSVTATGGSTTARGSGSNVIDLVSNVADNTGQFASLGGQTFNSTLNYAGIPNAVQLNQSFDGQGHRIINLRVPSVGLNRTFSDANGDLDTQIRDFLKKDGLAALSDFQAVANRTSIAGAVDGNPLAATALFANAGFQQFALHRTPFELNGEKYETADGQGENRFHVEGGVLRAGGVNGNYVDFTLAAQYHFTDRIALASSFPFRWTSIAGADIFMGGLVVGLPITIFPGRGPGSVAWQVTPAGHAGAVGSADFASGGLLYGGQFDSSFSINFGRGWAVTIANGVNYFHGADISVAGYDFDTKLDQWVFKNGVQLTKSWDNFFIDCSATWTNFLRDTFTDGFITPELGLGWRFGKANASGLRIGYTGNFGNHYNTNGGSILLFFTH